MLGKDFHFFFLCALRQDTRAIAEHKGKGVYEPVKIFIERKMPHSYIVSPPSLYLLTSFFPGAILYQEPKNHARLTSFPTAPHFLVSPRISLSLSVKGNAA